MKLAACVMLWLAAAAPASAAWLRGESAHFIVYSDGEAEALRRQVVELEDFHQLLRQLTGTRDEPAADKLDIFLVDGTAQLRRIWPRATGSDAGFYTASTQGILAVVDASAGRGWVGRNDVLFHEYAHHFMLQHFPAIYPQWYIEGFAEYLATARFEPETVEYGRMNAARASWIGNHLRWLPLDQLLFTNPEELDNISAAQFYAQSWLLVHYLLRDGERMGALNRYLVAVSRGEEPRAAFQAAFGTTPSQMHRQLRSYAARDMSFTRVRRAGTSSPAAVAVTPLPPSADRLLLLDAAMTTGGRFSDGFVRSVRRAAEGATDPFARRVLARAEALYGDGEAAERLLGELVAAAPRDAELLYLMGMRHLRAGRGDEANRAAHFRTAGTWFARAHRADDDHYPTLFHYAESLSADPAALLSDNTTNILLLAQQIAPQAHAIRLSTANLLMRRGRWEEAQAMLTPLASHSHAGALTRTARTLLAKARARDDRDLPDVFAVPADDD